ncbi:MAG: ATP-dependent DNA ligase [Eubacteriales bacterium]
MMPDIFETKNIKPMLISEDSEPFDSPDYIYELKLDGERCLAYLDENGTELRNKRNIKMLPKVPELSEIHKCVINRCILDGELFILKDGKPDFFEIQRRSLMSNKFKIELASLKYPASFNAFDILYYQNQSVTDRPLFERKRLLTEVVREENDRFSISRFIETQGIAFYELAKKQELEGIIAKKKDSKYYFGKRTKDWIKIKYLLDDDFVVCGYIKKENNMTSLVLGKYSDDLLLYKGHVTLGVSGSFGFLSQIKQIDTPLFNVPPGNEDAVWLEPNIVCTVKFMMKTASGGMRQPVFKGLRLDKQAKDCIE